MATKEQAIEQDKNEAVLKNNEGTKLFEQEDYEGAVKAFTEAVAHDSKFETAYFNRAMAYRKLGKHSEADLDISKYEALERAQEQQTKEAERQEKGSAGPVQTDKMATVKNDEGLRLLSAGDYQAAITAFTEAIDREPTLQSAYRNRAQAYRRLGRLDEADADLTQVESGKLSLSSVSVPNLGISSAGDVFEKLAYVVAIALGIGFAIGVWAILGTVGLITLFGMALFVWGIKWGWIWFLK